ncbi:papain fold toxin domain-containing protein [Tumidithrix elongata]
MTQNGLYYGVEAGGRVFDNLSTYGLPRNEWINDFDCPGGIFKVEEVERF